MVRCPRPLLHRHRLTFDNFYNNLQQSNKNWVELCREDILGFRRKPCLQFTCQLLADLLSQDFETAHWFELLFPFQKANTNHEESTVGMTKRLRRPDNKWRMCNCNNKRPAEANQPMCRGLQPAAASCPEPEFKKFFRGCSIS